MKNIFVATDFSKRSDAAVLRGAALAKALGATLTIAHIVDDDQSERLAAAAETEAGALFEALSASLQRDHGLAPVIVVTRGEPHAEILKAAENAGAELIIAGSHRRNLVRNTFAGTTAERSIRSSTIPILVARSPDGAPYERPLIALDLNERDLHPLERSCAMGIFDPKSVSVVFAYAMYGYHLLRQAGVTDLELQKYMKEEEQTVRPQVRSILKNTAMKPAEVILKPALFNVYDPLLETIKERQSDLIIVGTKRKQAFDRFRLGSVSDAILRRAEIDVLVIPPSDE